MSWAVEDWVWRKCTLEDHLERNVLLAIAWHAGEDGTTSKGPSIDTLAEMVRLDRKKVMAVISALEGAGELVVWRTAVTTFGRRPGNRYAVVMGRDPDAVRQAREQRHRARAPLAGTDQHAAPVRPSRGTAPTVPPQSHHGPETVPRRSRPERDPGLGLGTGPGMKRASAARSSPARAAPSTDPRLEPLRRELDSLDVSWQMTDEQAAAMAALIEVHGVRTLAAAALELVTARGRPTFARAWLGAWRALPVPSQQHARVDEPQPIRRERPWCGQCDAATFRFVVDDAGTPLHACPRCHPTSHLEPAF